jgi:protocatechuate 3,4-dioxygenase beta subunit
MSRKSVGILGLTLFIAFTLVGCDLISVVGVGKGSLRIQGIVLDEDNNGISGAAIEIDSKPVVFTGSDGKWSYDKATKGAKVDVKKDGYVFASGPILVESDNQTIHFLGKKEESARYAISGKVVDNQGRGIPSVRIVFTDAGGSTLTTLTDSQGSFSREGLIGSYRVTAEKDGYLIIDSFDVTGPDNVFFLAKETTPEVYTVSGRVVDDQGRGIPSVRLTFTDAEDNAVTTITDSQGNFTRDGLSGSYTVTATKDGYVIAGVSVSGPDNNLILLATETAPAVYSVSGKVVDEDGNGIPSVTITFRGGTEATTVTDAEGKFSRSGLRGTVTISAAKNGYTITEQFVVTGVDENITFVARIDQTPYEVMGRIVSTGGLAIEGVVISFADEKGGVKTAVTDADGYFWKSGLIGQAAVTAYLEGWLFTPETRVVNGPESDLNFYGTPDSESTYTVSGAVVDFDGVAISGASVRFDFLDLDRESLFTVTGPDGSWTMDGLIGRIQITPIKSGLTFYPAYQITDKAAMSIGFRAQ